MRGSRATSPAPSPPYTFDLIAGGRSNLTYRVTDGSGRPYALRRPPLSHVLPTAHDMAREYRVITALGPTDVPVPHTYGLCEDKEVNGSRSTSWSSSTATSCETAASARDALDEAGRRRAGMSLADTLAEAPCRERRRRRARPTSPSATATSSASSDAGPSSSPTRRWTGSTRPASSVRVHDKLAADIPEQQATAIVHGDYRLDNTVLGDDGTVIAGARLGDLHAG